MTRNISTNHDYHQRTMDYIIKDTLTTSANSYPVWVDRPRPDTNWRTTPVDQVTTARTVNQCLHQKEFFRMSDDALIQSRITLSAK